MFSEIRLSLRPNLSLVFLIKVMLIKKKACIVVLGNSAKIGAQVARQNANIGTILNFLGNYEKAYCHLFAYERKKMSNNNKKDLSVVCLRYLG